MAAVPEVVLFHHIQGRTAGVTAFADTLRSAGHTVHVPDLFGGTTFDTLAEGMDFARSVGFGVLADRGRAAAHELPSSLVYAGFSFGVMVAQALAQTRAGARGAVLMHGCLPLTEFGEAWPADVPVQVHGMRGDPFFQEDLDAAEALVASSDVAELWLYDGNEHLFADASLPSFVAGAATQMTERVLTFLDQLGAGRA